MDEFEIEQGIWRCGTEVPGRWQAYSAGLNETLRTGAAEIFERFGERPHGLPCPHAVFAYPLTARFVLVVTVADVPGPSAEQPLAFRALFVKADDYRNFFGDPFHLAELFPPTWEAIGDLPTLKASRTAPPRRTLAEVQAVLKRIKHNALKEGEDPESPDFVRTEENSESPTLLGGVQILVDGGRLAFQRRQGDLSLVKALWTLLPHRLRSQLWPTTFAFCNDLRFDVAVVPRISPEDDWRGYTTEDLAGDYPAGSYESALLYAAETGDERALEEVFGRRSAGDILRFAAGLLVFLLALVAVTQWTLPNRKSDPSLHLKASTAAGVVSASDPWTALGLLHFGNELFLPREAP